MPNGVISNVCGKFGFITVEDGGRDLFYHRERNPKSKTMDIGDVVEFTVSEDKNGRGEALGHEARARCTAERTSKLLASTMNDGDLIRIRMAEDGGYEMTCCDCSLVHRLDFTLTPDDGLHLRVYRLDEETKKARTENPPRCHGDNLPCGYWKR